MRDVMRAGRNSTLISGGNSLTITGWHVAWSSVRTTCLPGNLASISLMITSMKYSWKSSDVIHADGCPRYMTGKSTHRGKHRGPFDTPITMGVNFMPDDVQPTQTESRGFRARTSWYGDYSQCVIVLTMMHQTGPLLVQHLRIDMAHTTHLSLTLMDIYMALTTQFSITWYVSIPSVWSDMVITLCGSCRRLKYLLYTIYTAWITYWNVSCTAQPRHGLSILKS